MWETVIVSLTFTMNTVNIDSKPFSSLGQKILNHFKYILRAYRQVVRVSTAVISKFAIIIIIIIINILSFM